MLAFPMVETTAFHLSPLTTGSNNLGIALKSFVEILIPGIFTKRLIVTAARVRVKAKATRPWVTAASFTKRTEPTATVAVQLVALMARAFPVVQTLALHLSFPQLASAWMCLHLISFGISQENFSVGQNK